MVVLGASGAVATTGCVAAMSGLADVGVGAGDSGGEAPSLWVGR